MGIIDIANFYLLTLASYIVRALIQNEFYQSDAISTYHHREKVVKTNPLVWRFKSSEDY